MNNEVESFVGELGLLRRINKLLIMKTLDHNTTDVWNIDSKIKSLQKEIEEKQRSNNASSISKENVCQTVMQQK